ncbi:MAG: Stk1 family PASTA domain-containing Ser/Thr kinase [Oscillospiraceae bacterium]|nr:Stk1 family PASTA domain-containing Ser/Thr kinase [Oscillospiraceae bacterium]
MESNDKYIGQTLDNRYEILELIGKGGMAHVYKARCHRLNRFVAIKILKDELANDDEFRRRFHTESQAVAMLSHPNIVAVYDVSRSDNTEYIVMELIEGITLKQYINRKGILNWKEVLHFSTQVTKALSHAHSRGIIHRDIKPHNVMILKDGSVKVADFGIAQLLSVQNTMTQEALGSVHYISPEQAKGSQVDVRTDIYSLGVVMYEMLTNRLPFVGDSAVAVAIQHISAIPLMPRELNPDIPRGIEDIAMHAMESDLNMRFESAEEMLDDLEEFRKNPSISFNYTSSSINERNFDDISLQQETKVLQTAEVTSPPPRRLRLPSPPQRRTRTGGSRPELTTDEYRAARKRASKTSTLVGILIIGLFLLAVVTFMWNYLLKDFFSPLSRDPVEVPMFVNRVYVDVIANSGYNEVFNFSPPIYIYSDDVDEGLIIAQKPLGNTIVDAPVPGNKVNMELTVSRGAEPTVVMPNLIGKHYITAGNELDSFGLELEIITTLENSNEESGYVIATIPEEGALLARGYRVSIIYSGGPTIVERLVPDLLGASVAQVEAAFKLLDITPEFKGFENEQPEGTILFIESLGEMVGVPATLEVHYSLGPPVNEVLVPNLIGITTSQAEVALRSLEITPIFIGFISDYPVGTIIYVQYVEETIKVPATIDVHYSLGPQEAPETSDPYETFDDADVSSSEVFNDTSESNDEYQWDP